VYRRAIDSRRWRISSARAICASARAAWMSSGCTCSPARSRRSPTTRRFVARPGCRPTSRAGIACGCGPPSPPAHDRHAPFARGSPPLSRRRRRGDVGLRSNRGLAEAGGQRVGRILDDVDVRPRVIFATSWVRQGCPAIETMTTAFVFLVSAASSFEGPNFSSKVRRRRRPVWRRGRDRLAGAYEGIRRRD